MQHVTNPLPIEEIMQRLGDEIAAQDRPDASIEETAQLLDLALASEDREEQSRCLDRAMAKLDKRGQNHAR